MNEMNMTDTRSTVASEEAASRGLELARREGMLFLESLRHMVEVAADSGAMKTEGDYIIACAIEAADGMYMWQDGTLHWTEPAAENIHVEVVVADAGDGRFVPGLKVYALLIGPEENQIGPYEQPFLWHPTMFHYGRNWKVPGDGMYRLRVRIEPPAFPRHDKTHGHRYVDAVEAEFDNVQVTTGKK